MKKVLFSTLIVISLVSSAFAAPTKKVGSIIKNAFASNFRNAENVKWDETKDYYKASFVSNNVATEAYYDRKGDFIGSSHAITLDELPTAIKRSFAKKYGSYTVKEAIQFDAVEESAWYISAENEKQSVILKIANGNIEVYKSSNK